MAPKNRNPIVSAAIDAARREIVVAGASRDGTGVARCEAVIAIVCAMRDASPEDSARRETLQAEYGNAVETLFFCSIHDRYARGEIDMVGYREALDAGRASLAISKAEGR